MDGIFDKFCVVDEKSFSDFKWDNSNQNKLAFSEVTQFAALEFHIDNNDMQIADIGNVSQSDVPLAQIISWQWTEKGEQVIRETKVLNVHNSVRFEHSNSSIVVRIFKKRETVGENLCPPFSLPDDDFTVQIGDKTIVVSAHWLMSVSLVVRRMLSTEMREKQQRLITLDELGIDMEQFMEFVEAISSEALQTPILPNPTNVLMLLKLADFFQVDWLKSRCETHLMNCVEIPLVDRFLLCEEYRLDNLKNYFLHLNVEKLRAFFKSNRDQLLPVVSKQFLGMLSIRFC